MFRPEYTSKSNFNSMSSCGEILDANVCSKKCRDFTCDLVIFLKRHDYKLVVWVSIHVWVKFQLNIFMWWDSRTKCRFKWVFWALMRFKGDDLTFLVSQWFFWNALSMNLLFRSQYTSESNFNSISSCGEILDPNVDSYGYFGL